ncbi:hypothetical protein [uncultured Algimonas sp.]|uniref:hypothetical protein n=1 Tax=uncultured Algimonas sp. TaxID=1547920 RepID=UPI00263156FB|nr:hypothetical protein [uncultured Algimonas sp.]
MTENLGRRLAILRFIPIVVLVIVAFGLEYMFGVGRLWAAGAGLVVAVLVRLVLPKIWAS